MEAIVIAHPIQLPTHSPHALWVVECSIHGPLFVVNGINVDDLAGEHLAQHETVSHDA